LSRSEQRVLFFAYYYFPWNTSGVQRAARWAKFLPRYGYRPTVICSSTEGVLEGRPDMVHVPNPETEKIAGAQARRVEFVQRKFLPYNDQLPWVPHAVAAADRIIASTPVAAVMSTSPPVASHVAAGIVARKHKLPWIADFRDPIIGSPGRARKWAKPYDFALESAIFSSAAAVIATTNVIEQTWKRTHPRYSDKYHLIWNGFDPDEGFQALPIPARPYRTILHAGVVYVPRWPVWLAASLDRLIARGVVDPKTVRIRLVGTIQNIDEFRAIPAVSRLLQMGCLEADGQLVSRQQATAEVASSDYLLLLDIANLDNAGYAVPAKIFDYVLMGRPILASTPRRSPVTEILTNSGLPHALVHPDESDEEIDRKVMTFLQLPTEPSTPSDWFLSRFDGNRQVEMLAGILDGLTNHPR
jgi:hypothetical protein